LADQAAVPMIILTRQQDNVEAINSTLRNAGHAVHCTWVRDINDLADALTRVSPHIFIAFVGADSELPPIANVRQRLAPSIPLLFAREQVDEEIIASAMKLGAHDVITLANRARLQAVVTRELHTYHLEHALNSTLTSARDYRDQLKAFMAGSADAIAQVQEGIVVDVNPAWLELFGYPDTDAIVGQPLMDTFEPEAHAALKGALVACLQGKWSDHSLRVNGLLSDGSSVGLDIELSPTEFEAEKAVRVCVPSHKHDEREIGEQLHDAIELDATSGALQRRFFIERLNKALAQPLKGGVRQLMAIEPDKFASIAENIGPLGLDHFVGQFAAPVKEHLQGTDLVGRFGDGTFVVLLERGTTRDIEILCEKLLRKIAATVFSANDKSLTCTASIGVGLIDSRPCDPLVPARDALEALRLAQKDGGNRTSLIDHTDNDTKQQNADKLWVKLIKAALMENRFRLVQQPIASLMGDDKGMFDVLVRMLDEQGQEVLPSEFMPAAARNDLMKNIDRWVIAAAMAFCGSRPVKRLFVRLSRDSVKDRSLLQWLQNQLKASRIDPARIVFQVSEQVATEYLIDTGEFALALRNSGFLFAIEHFGAGREPMQLLEHLTMDYVKIDGSLMQSIAADNALQQRVKGLLEVAARKKIATIAERVEDANTMAVLWQLGVEFIQGYFVHEPEQVVLG
jgi:diguanylate cyclase (GGDEF)-like protein/PAS domain S-box-containing protein